MSINHMVCQSIAEELHKFLHKMNFVWPSKWGVPKILYLLNRYMAFWDTILLPYSEFRIFLYRLSVLITFSCNNRRRRFRKCSLFTRETVFDTGPNNLIVLRDSSADVRV